MRGFAAALRADTGLAVIAEIKRRSPSKGALNVALDPAALAAEYADAEFFGGSAADLEAARGAGDLPVLRKDFTVSRHDVADARLMGADAVLLIAAALDPDELIAYHELALDLGLDALVEVHDESELEVAVRAGATLVGVNQRDLVTFEVDHDRAARMAPQIPEGVVRVAESGVRDGADARRLAAAGYHAILVGETLVTAGRPAQTLAALRADPA